MILARVVAVKNTSIVVGLNMGSSCVECNIDYLLLSIYMFRVADNVIAQKDVALIHFFYYT